MSGSSLFIAFLNGATVKIVGASVEPIFGHQFQSVSLDGKNVHNTMAWNYAFGSPISAEKIFDNFFKKPPIEALKHDKNLPGLGDLELGIKFNQTVRVKEIVI